MPPDRRARAALLVAASLAIACSDDDAPPAGDDAAADAATEPDAGLPGPEAPGSPELTPCPAGWSERAGEVVVCEPFDPAPAGCPAGSIQLPGEPDCRSLGADCPDGDFATGVEAPEGTVRYVLAGAPAGGSGAIDDPFGSIAEALGRSDRGDVLALSRGTFAESVELPEGVTLAGACAAEAWSFVHSGSFPLLARHAFLPATSGPYDVRIGVRAFDPALHDLVTQRHLWYLSGLDLEPHTPR